ncbi:site-specific tyrosine recombinase/integron integrase [Lederbergia lenta]|uniref:Tyrosine recombinase XerC n=1 Tax=Lederbergia lenta TaxID=1467 RepID=A0A2X4ZHL9_LEDLE|nr:site-specific tyrosine recombinase/integron integrase [Lederbergia lenta]MEC2324419.1 tyrosine-type recombinase/integrase [Lederbergia lenta]SQI59944.1 tyrosine recombinase XerC [Lederbergia lenta]
MDVNVLESFFDDHHSRFSKETIRSYRLSLKQFFSFCRKNYNEVKATDIRAWLASMEEKGLKKRTIHIKLSGLKSFYQYCMEENLLKKNPMLTVKTPKKDDVLPYYLSRRQLAQLQELTRNDYQFRPIIETLYSTGVRVSELLQIKLEDIKWDTRQIWIRKGKGTKERFVLFSHDCAERLKMYLKKRETNSMFLFANRRGGPLHREYIQKNFRNFSTSLGFKVTPHTLRHTFAAHLAEKNMPQSFIQDLLGHVDINSTRIYTRLMDHARQKQYDLYH